LHNALLLKFARLDTLERVETLDTLADAGEMAGTRAIAMPIAATPIPTFALFNMTGPHFPESHCHQGFPMKLG
jgi:hypothetical protein